MWKLKVLKNRRTRASAELALAGSARTPNSGIQALDNSRGSSAAIAELVSSIGFALDQLDYDEEPGDFLRLQLERLAVESLKYQNCQVSDSLGEKWSCDAALARLLYASCLCSARVYDTESIEYSQDLEIQKIKYIKPSIDGTVKATAFWTLEQAGDLSHHEKNLIISVRGSARKTDHIVNLNDGQRDARPLFVSNSTAPVYAHAGFLNSATGLLPQITKELLLQITNDPSITSIIFTGHSAGGAVASLLFLHFVQHAHVILSSKIFSLVTFGSAPVISQSITKSVLAQRNIGLMLAIVNENDMVTRSDGPFLRSVVDLYRAKYVLPSISDGHSGEKQQEQRQINREGLKSKESWPLPAPAFNLVGDIIVLGEPAVVDAESPTVMEEEITAPKQSIMALKVAPEVFSKLLFCDIEVHRRRAYLERLELIWKEYNGEPQNDAGMGRQWLEDVLSWSDTDGSVTDDFCSLFTASTFSTSTTQ